MDLLCTSSKTITCAIFKNITWKCRSGSNSGLWQSSPECVKNININKKLLSNKAGFGLILIVA